MKVGDKGFYTIKFRDKVHGFPVNGHPCKDLEGKTLFFLVRAECPATIDVIKGATDDVIEYTSRDPNPYAGEFELVPLFRRATMAKAGLGWIPSGDLVAYEPTDKDIELSKKLVAEVLVEGEVTRVPSHEFFGENIAVEEILWQRKR